MASRSAPAERSRWAAGRHAGVAVERGGHDRQREPGGQEHRGGLHGPHGPDPAHGAEDDAVDGAGDVQQADAVGPRQAALGQANVQDLGQQRVRAQRLGHHRPRACGGHGLADLGHHDGVVPGEQGYDDGVAAGGQGVREVGDAREAHLDLRIVDADHCRYLLGHAGDAARCGEHEHRGVGGKDVGTGRRCRPPPGRGERSRTGRLTGAQFMPNRRWVFQESMAIASQPGACDRDYIVISRHIDLPVQNGKPGRTRNAF